MTKNKDYEKLLWKADNLIIYAQYHLEQLKIVLDRKMTSAAQDLVNEMISTIEPDAEKLSFEINSILFPDLYPE